MTRHDLKEQLQHDQFTDAVSGAVTYASSHRPTVIRLSIAAALVLVIGGGVWWYLASQAEKRQLQLASALSIGDAQVGATSEFAKTYPTEDAKRDAFMKALGDIIKNDSGTAEGRVAQYYRGVGRARNNDLDGAVTDLRAVAESSSKVAPLAKIALANIYISKKKGVEAQTLLQELVKDPTALVSKAQAQILQAQINETLNPQAAKDALKSIAAADQQRPAVKRATEQLSSEIAK